MFDELTHNKTKIVIKNNVPVAVIFSTEEYTRLIEMKDIAKLARSCKVHISKAIQKVSQNFCLPRKVDTENTWLIKKIQILLAV